MAAAAPSYFIGASLNGMEGQHITLTWLGPRTQAELNQIWAEVATTIPAKLSFEFPVPSVWRTFGKPADIAVGRGVQVRPCKPVDGESQLVELHHRWYYHQEGEAEERKDRPSWHLTAKSAQDKEQIDKLQGPNQCATVFLKQAGGPRAFELRVNDVA